MEQVHLHQRIQRVEEGAAAAGTVSRAAGRLGDGHRRALAAGADAEGLRRYRHQTITYRTRSLNKTFYNYVLKKLYISKQTQNFAYYFRGVPV